MCIRDSFCPTPDTDGIDKNLSVEIKNICSISGLFFATWTHTVQAANEDPGGWDAVMARLGQKCLKALSSAANQIHQLTPITMAPSEQYPSNWIQTRCANYKACGCTNSVVQRARLALNGTELFRRARRRKSARNSIHNRSEWRRATRCKSAMCQSNSQEIWNV